MRVYYDPATENVTNTYSGPSEFAPSGDYIEMTYQDLGDLFGLKVQNGILIRTDLSGVKASAISRINERGGQVRKTFVTDLPGQQMLYQEKEREAAAYVAETPEPATLVDYPLIASEVGPGLTAPTALELAQIWLNMAAQWKIIAGQIENARLGAIYAVEAATSVPQIEAIEAAYMTALA